VSLLAAWCDTAMRSLFLSVVALLTVATAFAAPSASEQLCLAKAADALPRIAGMKIGMSRVTRIQPYANWPATLSTPMKVEIEWSAPGQRATWAYLCAVDEGGQPRLQRLVQ
jgi:hypothetical protein